MWNAEDSTMNPCQSGAGLQAAAAPGYDLLRRAGLYEVASHAGAINTTLNTVHLTLRANERAKRLSLPAAQDMQSIIERDATTVQNHAKEARRLLKEQLKGKTWQ